MPEIVSLSRGRLDMTGEFHLEYCVLTYSDTLVEDVACYCWIHFVAVLLLSIINELGIESWYGRQYSVNNI